MNRMRRRIYCLFLLLFLFSCSPQASRWETVNFSPSKRGYCPQSHILFRPTSAMASQLGMRLSRGTYGERLYVESYALPLPTLSSDRSKSPLTIILDGKKETIIATRLQGGHRLLIPDEVKVRLMQSLLNDHPIQIACGCCRGDITSTDFASHYERIR